MIKAVFLDVDNTLLDFNACMQQSLERAFAEFGIDCTPEIMAVYARVNRELREKLLRGEISREEHRKTRFARIFAELGLALDGPEFEDRFLAHLKTSAVRIDGAEELMRHLSGKYLVCVASNTPHDGQDERLANAELLYAVQHVFTSKMFACSKPSREFFDACFKRLPDLKPEECIMIGDSLVNDIGGALDYGMHACWFNPKGAALPEGLDPDYVVHDLREICEIL